MKSKALIIILLMTAGSCTKWVQVNPPDTSLSGQDVYTTDATAASVLTGIYTNMSDGSYFFTTGMYSFSLVCGLSADEFALFGGSNANVDLLHYYQNNVLNTETITFWTPLYQLLLQINAAIEGLNTSTGLTPAVKQQLLGEALFLRAFANFYLVNLYGNVPLVTTSNYKTNATIATSPSEAVWQQIVADLNNAQQILSSSFLDATLLNPTTERVRPTKWAAASLLARAYLYTGVWDSAEAAATTVINNGNLFSLDTLNGVFLKNSTEAIWQLQPVIAGQNTMDAMTFILAGGPNTNTNPVSLSSYLLSAFEPRDLRWLDWVAVDSSTGTYYYYPYKYKSATYNAGSPVTEYLMVLRLAEQYLIRAEARAYQNNLAGAMLDLDAIRERAGLSDTALVTQTGLLGAIQHERQIEFFSEWGNRWLDLKRTGAVDSMMSMVTPQKGGTWNSDWQFYPVPLYDLQQDANIKQNAGY